MSRAKGHDDDIESRLEILPDYPRYSFPPWIVSNLAA